MMEGFDALDLLNTAIAAFAILGGMVYAIIKTKVDVEHLTKKVETLFNLFNNIQAQKNRLVIAAKKPPNQLDVQLADLKSRLTSGLCLQLINPDDEDKKQILSNLAQRYGLELSRECSNYLLTHHGRNLRDLIKTLQTLDQAAWIEQRRLTIPFIKQCLAQQTQALY